MIGVVIVSHSAKLAEGVCELAAQVAQGKVRLAAAGGTSDPQNPIGTDAFRVLEAIQSVYSDDGVLVFTDLGSAVLSAETALEFLDPERRAHVQLCDAPLVEGTIAAVSRAAVEQVSRPVQSADAGPSVDKLVTLPNRLGLHARPAAQFVRITRRFHAVVTVENVSRQLGPVDAAGINGLLGLAARQGHQLLIRARGPEAHQALAELSTFLEAGCGDKDVAPEAASAVRPLRGELSGIPASAGIAIGPLVKLDPDPVTVTRHVVDDPEAEWQRLLHAIRGAKEDTRALVEWATAHVGANEAGIFDAQLLFLEDAPLIASARRIVLDERANAEFAWQAVTEKLNARADDVADVTTRVLRRLTGVGISSVALREPAIVAAHDIAPSTVKELDPDLVLGLCLETGSANAHSVIMARARGIPAVVGMGPGIRALTEGTTVALDGERGLVWVSPEPDEIRALDTRREVWLAARREALAGRHRPAATRDGHRIRVLANINSVADAAEAVECGAEGVGVLRTEFLFLGRPSAPSEDEQLAAYGAIAETVGSRPLVVRTLDIGGDKRVPYVEIGEEANPFLGLRGIRLTLSRRDLLRTQLRAILRAGAGRAVDVLLPMVSSLAEFVEAKAVLGEVEAELQKEQVPFQKDMKVGVMIEVPAAVAIADQLAAAASFFSIGTNDLVQYVMAADRTNARAARIADPFQPAVLRMIGQAASAGRNAGIGVTLCGEMAADPLATPLLLGLGVEEFSVSAPLIPELKRAIARWSLPEAQALAREALALDSSESVRRLVE